MRKDAIPSSARRAKAAIRRLGRDTRGVSVIELAIVAPVLGLMVLGISDLARGFSERYFLQQAANRTLELAQFGTSGANSNFDHLAAEAAAAADVPATNVTVEQWLECNDVSTGAFTGTCPNATDRVARYVRLTVKKSFKPLFSTAGYGNVQANGTVLLSANASLRVQ